LDWIAICSALSHTLRTLDKLALSGDSDYLKASLLHDSLDVLAGEFSRGGIDVSGLPQKGIPPSAYQQAALKFMEGIFEAPHG
jgi:hypothetical protein